MADVNGTNCDLVSLLAAADRLTALGGTYAFLGGIADGTSPVVTPSSPSALTGQTSPVAFTVSDETELRGVCVVAAYVGSNTRELVWDSTHGFNGFYLGTANRQTATVDPNSGKVLARAFSVLRDGGWPTNITLTVFAFDDGGNSAGGF